MALLVAIAMRYELSTDLGELLHLLRCEERVVVALDQSEGMVDDWAVRGVGCCRRAWCSRRRGVFGGHRLRSVRSLR